MSSTLIWREEWLPFYVIFEVVFFACLRLQNDPTGLLSGFLYFTFSFPFFNFFFLTFWVYLKFLGQWFLNFKGWKMSHGSHDWIQFIYNLILLPTLKILQTAPPHTHTPHCNYSPKKLRRVISSIKHLYANIKKNISNTYMHVDI